MNLPRSKLLLTLLILIALIAIGGWLTVRVWTGEEQTDFLNSIKADGGSVVMDFEEDGRPAPQAPNWLRSILGDLPYNHAVKITIPSGKQAELVGRFEALRELDCSATSLSAEEWKSIYRCQRLRKLSLPSNITETSELEGLQGLHELVSLDFTNGRLENASYLTCFKHMQQIKTLRLPDLDDKDLRRLRFLKQLEELDLQGTSIQGPGLSALSGMTHLRRLNLSGNPIAGEHLAHLRNLDSLEELDLSNTSGDDESMASLVGLKSLKRLNLLGTHVRGAGLRKLYPLKNHLALSITLNAEDMENVDGAVPFVALGVNSPKADLTETGFDHLTLYPMLEELDLSFSNMDDTHAKLLSDLTNLKKLDLARTRISDAALEHLRELKDLRELHVDGTHVTEAGKQKLRAALPHLKFDGEE
jgi:uncharacterized protein YjbI with pentapeptide repeats